MYLLIAIMCTFSMSNINAATTGDDMEGYKLRVYVQPSSDELGSPSLEGARKLAFYIENKGQGISCDNVYGRNLGVAPDFPPNQAQGWHLLTKTYPIREEDYQKFMRVLSGLGRDGLTDERSVDSTEEFASFVKSVCKPNFEHTVIYQKWLNEKDSGELWISSVCREYTPLLLKIAVPAVCVVMIYFGVCSNKPSLPFCVF